MYQLGANAVLLRNVSDAAGTLVRDVNVQGDGDQLLGMCCSEFGRRVAEIASDGTGHGAADPVFFADNGASDGVVGGHPRLDGLQTGDLKSLFDFRQVCAATLQRWLEFDIPSVLGVAYGPVALFANSWSSQDAAEP